MTAASNIALQQTDPGVTPLAGFSRERWLRTVARKGATRPAAERGRSADNSKAII